MGFDLERLTDSTKENSLLDLLKEWISLGDVLIKLD